MSTPGIAIPGSVVPSGSAVSPGGAQGIPGAQGPAGASGGGGGTGGTLTMAVFRGMDGQPPTSNYAYFASRDSGALGVLQFVKTGNVDTSAIYTGLIPQGTPAFTTGLKVTLFWASVTATTGNVEWSTAVDNIASHSIDTDSYGTAVVGTPTPPAGAAVMTSTTISIPNANLQSLSAEQPFKLLVTRKASDTTNDTMSDIVSLFLVTVKTY